MTKIVNLEGDWGRQAAAEIIVGRRFVAKIAAVVEGGEQRLIVRDYERRILAEHTQPKGLPWGADKVDEWVESLRLGEGAAQ